MERRKFLAASLAATATAATGGLTAQTPGGKTPEYYQLRRYSLQTGPQLKLTEDYFTNALIPALTQKGFGPVGAFKLDIGQDTPMYSLLIPGPEVEALARLDMTLAEDAAFVEKASAFWNAKSTGPAFQRVEISMLRAFPGWPRVTPPAGAATKARRILQLRTYESPSNGEHVRKVEMFHSGEFEIFLKAGFHPVFFGDALTGARLPNLTYMLAFENTAELEAKWDVFRNDPDWKKLSTSPRFAFDTIVTNISNVMLSPLACSQI